MAVGLRTSFVLPLCGRETEAKPFHSSLHSPGRCGKHIRVQLRQTDPLLLEATQRLDPGLYRAPVRGDPELALSQHGT